MTNKWAHVLLKALMVQEVSYALLCAVLILLSACSPAPKTAEIFLQLGHSSKVTSVAYSPDGRFIASGSADKTVKIWKSSSGTLLRTLGGHSDMVTSISYSPDGKFIASGSADKTVKIWEASTGILQRTISGHSEAVYIVSYSPDGKFIASGSADKTVTIWEVSTGILQRTISGHSEAVYIVSYSPDGKFIASGSRDKTVKIWEASSGNLQRTLSDHSKSIESVCYSPDGRYIASGSVDKTVKIWDTSSGQLLHTLIGHTNTVTSVIYSPDGRFIISGSWDKSVKIWDASSGKLQSTLSGHSDTVTSVSYSRDGHYIASGSWDKTVKIWDTRSDTLQRNISWHSGWVDSVIYSPDGKFIASGSWDKTAKIWEASSGNLQRTLSDHSKAIESVCYSPDGRYIASGSVDKTVKIWEASSGQLLHTLIGHSNTVTSVIYSPDGQFITSGSWDKSVKIWDASSGKLQRTLSGHSDTVTSVSYSRDGCYIASGSWDTTVKIWDASSGKLHRTLSGHTDRVFGVSYSPDGQFIASGSWDKTVKIWDASSGKLIHTLAGHSKECRCVSYSPDGRSIASGSWDKTVKIWDASSGKLIHTLAGHSSVVTSVNYSPDGNFIASGGFDDTIVIHNAETGDIVSITALLPGNEWLTFNDKKLLYVSSLQGDEYAAVRFDNATWSVYPLKYYRKELKRENFGKAAVEQQPMIRPKPFKVWWDTSEDKGLVGGVAFFGIVTFAFIYNLMKRSDPIVVARAFFKGAGFSRLKPRNKGLYLLSKPNEKALTMAVLWKGDHIIGEKHIEVVINSEKGKYTGKPKIYLIYKEDKHNISEGVKSLRNTYVMTIDIIPLASPILEESLGSLMCKDRLKELEEPYLIRTDPYLERLPVFDPIWFYGREDLIERLPLLISQGQHVCLCGLRKVGKTSLSNQLRQRFVNSPMVYIDCQAMGTSAAAYYKEVSNQFRNKLSSSKIKKLPQIPDDLNGDTFRTIFLLLVRKWEKAKHREQFIIFFDEIDKLFVDRKLPDSEHLLAEYVRLFRVLRGLAQSERCLTTVVITYRPDINRQNNLMETVGENPMYNSFAEEYLGYWNSADSEKMLREIGHWKEIIWSEDSPLRVYELCGGDPLITRMFASAASNKGKLKVITLHRVEETAAETIRTFSENDIGNHYKESILGTLTMDEKQLINHVHAAGASGFNEEDTPSELLDALANLKRFTLVYLENGKLKFRAKLFFEWLKWRM